MIENLNIAESLMNSFLMKKLIYLQSLYSLIFSNMIGPNIYGKTIHVGLSTLVTPIRRNPERLLQPGSLAILNTENDTIEFVKDDWLTSLNTKLPFVYLLKSKL